jgi:hypothetical protein
MFPLNTILAWSINIIMNKKYDNNNIIIIASRAYFLQMPPAEPAVDAPCRARPGEARRPTPFWWTWVLEISGLKTNLHNYFKILAPVNLGARNFRIKNEFAAY